MNDAPTCGAAGCGWDDPSVRGVAPVAFAAPTHLTDWTCRRPDVMSMLTRSRRIDYDEGSTVSVSENVGGELHQVWTPGD